MIPAYADKKDIIQELNRYGIEQVPAEMTNEQLQTMLKDAWLCDQCEKRSKLHQDRIHSRITSQEFEREMDKLSPTELFGPKKEVIE